jgi:hypothetical protein
MGVVQTKLRFASEDLVNLAKDVLVLAEALLEFLDDPPHPLQLLPLLLDPTD